ncbi:uncharacterized protein LOC143292195 [Babylonia areolata]|uniref:uncharacterized protein LOC143292195 n=1 Tax=Babylonia areolata TaxID=304850 RepID=UPI003FD611AC
MARFSARGVKATITFKQNGTGETVQVIRDGAVFWETPNITWRLHALPVQYDVKDRCRSIVIFTSHNDTISCANVERTGRYVTARADFRRAGILGTIILRQDVTSENALTRLFSDLYSRDPGGEGGRMLEWVTVDGDDGCSVSLPPYDPKHAVGVCSEETPESCAVGNMTGKFGRIAVGHAKGTRRWTRVDLNLPLSGVNSVIGKTVQLFGSDDPGRAKPMACATITKFAPRTGVATFDQRGVSGDITLTQASPLDPTVTKVALQNLRSLAVTYGVYALPVPQRVLSGQSLCGDSSVAERFNPFGVTHHGDNDTAPGESTEDMYEVGDLSGKYGTLALMDHITDTFVDYNLPLVGALSVLGRSIVIHKTDGSRWVCSTIRDTAKQSYALATFRFPVIGFVLFRQRGTDRSRGVGVRPAGLCRRQNQRHQSDWLSTDPASRCLSTGAVFDPYSALSNPHCNSSAPKLCKVGDVSTKHGQFSVRSVGGPSRSFFTDTDMVLQGAESIIGRSIVLTGADGSDIRIVCADIEKLHPRRAEVAVRTGTLHIWSVTFSQNTWIIQEPTLIRTDVKPIWKVPLEYHISTIPVDPKNNDQCHDLVDIYNPFHVTHTAAGGTKDSVEVGDLSGKFGNLLFTSRNVLDPTLDLMGPRSVVGRALGLSSDNESVACGSIEDRINPGGVLVSAVAIFTGDVVGRIAMTKTHKWHVHENHVGDDVTATSGRCQSAGGHFNPFMVNVKVNYAECHAGNPLRCELGDQANKLGPLDMGSDVMLGTDVNLPLAGPFTVLGRSIVIHGENATAPRIACADIVPDPQSAIFDDLYVTSAQQTDRSAFAEAFSRALKTPRYNVLVHILISRPQINCTGVRVYFLGLHAGKLKKRFIELMDRSPDMFGSYTPCGDGMTEMTQ